MSAIAADTTNLATIASYRIIRVTIASITTICIAMRNMCIPRHLHVDCGNIPMPNALSRASTLTIAVFKCMKFLVHPNIYYIIYILYICKKFFLFNCVYMLGRRYIRAEELVAKERRKKEEKVHVWMPCCLCACTACANVYLEWFFRCK